MSKVPEGSRLNKRQKLTRGIVTFMAAHGGISAALAAEVTPFHEMTGTEKTMTVVTDFGQAADDASSANDVAKKAEEIYQQLTSKADVHPSPEADPEGGDQQKVLLDLEGDQEKEKKKKADKDLALGDHEEVSAGNIIAPASPACRESAVTGEARAEAAGEADQARADDESREQAAAEDEERLGRPAEESEPGEETWVNDEAWVEDEAWLEDHDDVNDPDID
jgi:hypothetical protein